MFTFHVLIVFVPALSEHWGLIVGLFFAAGFLAMWPCLFRSAPYSFWVFACVYWVVGVVLMAFLKAALLYLA